VAFGRPGESTESSAQSTQGGTATTFVSIRPQSPSVAVAASQGQARPTCQADPADDERQPVPLEDRTGWGFFGLLSDVLAELEAAQKRFLGELGFRNRAEAALRDLKA